MGYVNRDATGWTELRVHGVAGTPPISTLEHPHVRRVAGDQQAGFYRREWQATEISADTVERRLEAYSWGGLTSGDNKRALWLLLLPFMLLNVAFFMAPSPPGRTVAYERGLDRFGAAQRLLALSFTATFTLVAITVGMDLIGWQCAAGRPPDGDVCGASWLGWLGWAWLDLPARQVAVTALVPLLAVGLLWWPARTTWNDLERADVPQITGEPDLQTPLEDRAMWNGRAPVRRLRALHVTAAIAICGVFVVAPLPPGPAPGLGVVDGAAWASVPAVLRTAVLLLLLVLLAAVVVRTARPSTAHRARPAAGAAGRTRQEQDERGDAYRWSPWCALALTVLAMVLAWFVPPGAVAVHDNLPWLVGTVHGLFLAQLALVVAILAFCLRLRPRGPSAWHGLGTPGIVLLAWVLAGGFSAGVVLRVAQTLGTPVGGTQASDVTSPLVVPTAFSWTAVAGLALVPVALACALRLWWRLRRPSPAMRATVRRVYGNRTDGARLDGIARGWTRAQGLPREAERALGTFLVAAGAVVAAGIGCFLTIGPHLVTDAAPLVAAGNLVLTGFVLALLWVGRQAYRNPAARRTIGIAWDLGTFWPRAVHPLAPPCYAERAIPDLMGRLRLYTTENRRALLSCHSQGSVLGAAVLLQVETPVSGRTSFLSYGSPLMRLYARFFPAYFSAEAIGRVRQFLGEDGSESGAARWRNLHRLSDPIGGSVSPPGPHPVDRLLVDPEFARTKGDPCYPPTHGHSNYFDDPRFARAVDELRHPIRGAAPAEPAPAGQAGVGVW